MDLEQWQKDDMKKISESVATCLGKMAKGEKTNILEDLFPEYGNLKGKSYTHLTSAGSIEGVERLPTCNLGLLLGSGLYDNVLFPLRCVPEKTRFEMIYGLTEERGCHLSFDQLLDLIRNGKVTIMLETQPINYKAGFYEQIFKACEELPSFSSFAFFEFMNALKLSQIARSEKIKIKGDWKEKVEISHPEYTLDGCISEVKQVFGKEFLEQKAREQERLDWFEAAAYAGSRLVRLRQLGFEGLAGISLRLAHKDKALSAWALAQYDYFLAQPLYADLLSFSNYSIEHIRRMSLLKLLPKKLDVIWNDILSSSPLSSSVVSSQTNLETVELKGSELLALIESFADDDTRILRRNIMDVNESLSRFDISSAERRIDRIDEIITESINSEIRRYETKGRVSGNLLRLGKTFATMASEGLILLSGLMATTGKFEWAGLAFAGAGLPLLIRNKIQQIKPEDVVKWWSKTWPFEDPGIGFFMWEKQAEDKRKGK